MKRPGRDAVAVKGWFGAHRFLIARRASQTGILALFLLGPLAGWWIVKGNLNSSLTLGVLPLTDPFVLAQSLFAGHWPETAALLGALIVAVFYALVGGRVYCSWVCPVNLVTDAAAWLRQRLGLQGISRLPRATRQGLLIMTFAVSAAAGVVAWEVINPVSMFHRGLVFGIGLAWVVVLGVFLLDVFVSPRSWCGHLCPVGAFYGWVGHKSFVRVRAEQRAQCNDCGDCYDICPEPQVLRAPLKDAAKGVGPVILADACTNCGRCIDVCSKDVFVFGLRFQRAATAMAANEPGGEIQSAVGVRKIFGECDVRSHQSNSR